MCAVGALRGSPASTTRVRRLERPRIRAALSPAVPPPTTTTSYAFLSMPGLFPRPRVIDKLPCRFCNGCMDEDARLDAVLNEVGPRLRRIRRERGATLGQ